MTHQNLKDPGSVLDKTDPGDDTQRRFRYQHAYAAIQCVRLIRDEAVEAVYCENHEDVLVKYTDGTFVAVQVKTKAFDLEPFKAHDEPMINSLARFAKLEKDYPEKFVAFRIVTNHSFFKEDKSSKSLPYLLKVISETKVTKTLRATSPAKALVEAVCKKADCTEAQACRALAKCHLDPHESDLEKSDRDLLHIVSDTRDFKHLSFQAVQTIADNLVYLTYKASSLTVQDGSAGLYSLVGEFSEKLDELKLAGKTITSKEIEEHLAEWTKIGAENLLVAHELVPVDGVPDGVDVLVEKLSHGGLQAERIDVLKDYKASMEKLYLEWRYKYGVEKANERLAHLRTLVRDDCVEAKIEAEGDDPPIAPKMYTSLRTKLNARAGADQPMLGTTPEHLLGTAAILTEECTVWWSEQFELKSRSVS